MGFSYTVLELKTKMQGLTAQYRKEKLKMETTKESPSEWDLFQDMQTLLAPFESLNYQNLVQDSINDINSIIEVSSPLPSRTASPLPLPTVFVDCSLPSIEICPPSPLQSLSNAKVKKKDSLYKLLTKFEMNVERIQKDMKNTLQKMLEIEEEKKTIFKEYIDREAEVQKALVEFLKMQ